MFLCQKKKVSVTTSTNMILNKSKCHQPETMDTQKSKQEKIASFGNQGIVNAYKKVPAKISEL